MTKANRRIIAALSFYIIYFCVFFGIRNFDHFGQSEWSDKMLYLLFLIPPVLMLYLMWTLAFHTLKNGLWSAFIASALFGYFPGAIIGIGFYEMAHGSGILGHITSTFLPGLATSLLFVAIGLPVYGLFRFIQKRQKSK